LRIFIAPFQDIYSDIYSVQAYAMLNVIS